MNQLFNTIFFIYLYLVCHSIAEEKTTYQHNGKVCRLCPPGMKRVEYCVTVSGNLLRNTICDFCIPGETYTAHYNTGPACYACSKHCPRFLEIIVRGCLPTSNVKCECMHGFYLRRKMDPACLPLKKCEVGYGVKVTGTSTSNTVCEKCQEGYFSSIESSHASCMRHTDCTLSGKALLALGNCTSDNICGDEINTTRITDPASTGVLLELLNTTVNTWSRDNKSLPIGELVDMSISEKIMIGILVPVTFIVIVGFITFLIRCHQRVRSWLEQKLCGNSVSIGGKLTKTDEDIKSSHETEVHQNTFSDSRKVQNRRSVTNLSSGSEGTENESSEMSHLYKRSHSQSQEFPCPEFVLWDMDDEQFMYFIAKEIKAEDNKWKEVLTSLPAGLLLGAIKVQENVISRAWIDHKETRGITHVIFVCLQCWHQSNPDIDVVDSVVNALKTTKEPFHERLADIIEFQKNNIPKTTVV